MNNLKQNSFAVAHEERLLVSKAEKRMTVNRLSKMTIQELLDRSKLDVAKHEIKQELMLRVPRNVCNVFCETVSIGAKALIDPASFFVEESVSGRLYYIDPLRYRFIHSRKYVSQLGLEVSAGNGGLELCWKRARLAPDQAMQYPECCHDFLDAAKKASTLYAERLKTVMSIADIEEFSIWPN